MGMEEYMRMKELHSAGCTIYDSTALYMTVYCTIYDSTAQYMTVLHYIWQYCTLYDSTAQYCTLWRMQLRSARLHQQQCGPGHQPAARPSFPESSHRDTAHSYTQLYLHWQLGSAVWRSAALQFYTDKFSYIYTNSLVVQWTSAISFTFIRIRSVILTDKRAVQWASAISFTPLRG